MSFAPTEEQQSAVDAFASGENVKIYAGAGTGKTSALRFIAENAGQRRGLYLAFNKSVADDARARFRGTNASPSTVHSLAYGVYGAPNRERLNQRKLFPPQMKSALDCETRFPIGDTFVSWQTLVRLARETVTAFCRSMHPTITSDLVTLPPTVLGKPEELDSLRQYVTTLAERWWEDLMSPSGRINWTHDVYLKRWAMDEPQLPYDYVMVDEAQDLEPLTRGLMLLQDTQVVVVGDENQAIYGWRGAVNALESFDGERVQLTQSFRFGEAIAEEANFWLAQLESDMRLTGRPGAPSSVWKSERRPEAVLTRSNGGTMQEIIDAQRSGLRVGIAGERKAQELTQLAQAALDLQTKGRTSHRELDTFTNWAEVVQFVEEDNADNDLAALVRVVNTYGAPAVVEALNRTVHASQADQIISTVHIAKGLEWLHVRISDDFREPKVDRVTGEQEPLAAEEARLAYVAVTRAQRHLDASGLDWARTMTGGVAV